jgi:cysteine desulfurase
MGISDEQARSSLRISLSIFTTRKEVDAAVEALKAAVAKLRSVQGGGVGPVVIYGS